jgi:hypothetical protein
MRARVADAKIKTLKRVEDESSGIGSKSENQKQIENHE